MKPYDLSQLDLSLGAGVVGYSASVSYAAGTVGDALKKIGTALPTFTPGALAFGGPSGGLAQDAANLFWDDANNMLGIGVSVLNPLSHSKLNLLGDLSFKGGGTLAFNGYHNGTNWKAFGAGYMGSWGYDASQGTLVFYNTPTSYAADANITDFSERFRITPAGNVGIAYGALNGISSTLQMSGDISLFGGGNHIAFNGYIGGGSWKTRSAGRLGILDCDINTGDVMVWTTPNSSGVDGVNTPLYRFVVTAAGKADHYSDTIQANVAGFDNGEGLTIRAGTGGISGVTFAPGDNRLMSFGVGGGSPNYSFIRALNLTMLSTNNLYFGPGGSPKAHFDTSGNLNLWQTNSNVLCKAAGSGGVSIQATGDVHTGYLALFRASDAARMAYIGFIDSSAGGSPITYTNENGGPHTFNATCYAPAFTPTSDERLKTNIKPVVADAGALIDAITVVEYDWIDGDKHAAFGVTAQQLQTVNPNFIEEIMQSASPSQEPGGDPIPPKFDTLLGVDTFQLLCLALKEIQSLRARLAKLELPA